MNLGIEIGGTKIQLAAGLGDGSRLMAVERFDVDQGGAAEAILEGVERAGRKLIAAYRPRAVGIGFGGPVDMARGRTIKSHHVAGWEDFPLGDWCRRTLDLPAVIANDADTAGLAEARFGAGRHKSPVFYITIGTGIGGALILDGHIYRGAGNAASEVGHLRPGLHADRPGAILEALAAGWGIAAEARRRVETASEQDADAADLRNSCAGRLDTLTAKLVGEAALAGNLLAQNVLEHAWQALGWGIAQVITLVSPQVIVIGGGVSQLGEKWCFEPLRREVARYVFPPLAGSYEIAPATLGEEVVLHGALALARNKGAH